MSREEAIEQLKVYRACMLADGAEVEAYNMAIEALKEQYLEGYWRQIGYDIYECTVCSQNVMTGDICAYKHCHGCGAKMIEPQESEG